MLINQKYGVAVVIGLVKLLSHFKSCTTYVHVLDCADHRAYTTFNWGAGGIEN